MPGRHWGLCREGGGEGHPESLAEAGGESPGGAAGQVGAPCERCHSPRPRHAARGRVGGELCGPRSLPCMLQLSKHFSWSFLISTSYTS